MIKKLIVNNGQILLNGSANKMIYVIPTLATPRITKNENLLLIEEVEHATSYKIFQNDILLSEISATNNSLSFNLSSIPYPVINGVIKVIAQDNTSSYAESKPAILSELYPTQQTPSPTAEQVVISGQSMSINTSATADNNLIILKQEDQIKGMEKFLASQLTISLGTIKALDGTVLPDGTYDVDVYAEKNGQAISGVYDAGSFNKGPIYVILDPAYWRFAKSFTIVTDVEAP